MKKLFVLPLLFITATIFASCKQLPIDTSSDTSTITSIYSEIASNEETPSDETFDSASSEVVATTSAESAPETAEPTQTVSKDAATSTTSSKSPFKIPKEPLPEGVVCRYSWLENIARAATEEELQAYKAENGRDPYCEDCGRPTMAMSVDGKLLVCGAIYGTCMSRFTGGDWTCECCGAGPIPVNACHTCGEPIVLEPLPGTPIDSIDQLTEKNKMSLYGYARSVLIQHGDNNAEGLVSVYTFNITDNSSLNTRAKCVCFYIFQESGEKHIDPPYTPIYHYGLIYDMSVLDDGRMTWTTQYNDTLMFKSEAEVVGYFQKLGTDITKIR